MLNRLSRRNVLAAGVALPLAGFSAPGSIEPPVGCIVEPDHADLLDLCAVVVAGRCPGYPDGKTRLILIGPRESCERSVSIYNGLCLHESRARVEPISWRFVSPFFS